MAAVVVGMVSGMVFFFFQAEDGIRDLTVTGVQTCALPIYLVTAELTPEEIKAVMEEVYASREPRNLLGFEIETEGVGYERRITAMRLADGRTLERDKRYSIAFNTFDSRSGGHRFMKLRALLETPATRCTFDPVQTRDAMIDYFRRHQGVPQVGSQGHRAAA